MQLETLRDVLHWTTEFHRQLAQCLSYCTDRNTEERARRLLAYLADHEEALRKVTDGFEKSGNEQALNTWCVEYIQKYPIALHQNCDAPFADLGAEQIMEIIVKQHQQLIELYRYLASRADTSSARELLESLKSLEEHEMMRMVQSANRYGDM